MVLEDPEGIDAWEAMKESLPPLTPEDQARVDALMDQARKPLSPGDPRRHHFIPQFYQRRFATEDEQLLVIPIDGSRPRLTHVTNIAVMSDLYTSVDVDVGETVAVERLLAVVDGLAAGIFPKLSWGFPFPPTELDRGNLAMWLAFLHVRDPHTRRTMEAMAEQMLKIDLSLAANPEVAWERLRSNLVREPTDEEVEAAVDAANHLDDFEIAEHQSNLIKMMLDTGLAMVPHLANRSVIIMRFPEGGLLLCDRPLVLFQREENRQPDRGFGIIDADEILLPVDRRTVLILHNEPEMGEQILDAPPGYAIENLNQIVVSNAVSEVYCHPADEHRLKGLEFPEPDRPLLRATTGSWFTATIDGINAPPTRRRHRRWRSPE